MPEKEVKDDRWWRGAVLIVLCSLVYLLSYDQGRQSIRPSLEEARRVSAQETEARDLEIRRLEVALKECRERPEARDGVPDRISLRVNQSRILFNGRLVISLLEVDRPENLAVLQFNFLKEEKLLLQKLAAGGSFRFSLDDRNWALVASSLSISSANLNLVELKEP